MVHVDPTDESTRPDIRAAEVSRRVSIVGKLVEVVKARPTTSPELTRLAAAAERMLDTPAEQLGGASTVMLLRELEFKINPDELEELQQSLLAQPKEGEGKGSGAEGSTPASELSPRNVKSGAAAVEEGYTESGW